ncbi:hypothetical protein PSR1_03016 [Anaeromyxobacter sp. PSR-1]|nr:hypothetical protein PSR1_03016 [Anaeromyxobacter sp. PSR-1]
MRTPGSTCQWMPRVRAPSPCAPPTCTTSTVRSGVLEASPACRVITFSRSPTSLVGQWHCSHVSRAGRRFWTGVGMGRG